MARHDRQPEPPHRHFFRHPDFDAVGFRQTGKSSHGVQIIHHPT